MPYMKLMLFSRSSRVKTMIREDFKDELLDKLNELRETNVLCDTTIRTEGQDFAAHKCVLSAASAYFRALFTSQMRETKEQHGGATRGQVDHR